MAELRPRHATFVYKFISSAVPYLRPMYDKPRRVQHNGLHLGRLLANLTHVLVTAPKVLSSRDLTRDFP